MAGRPRAPRSDIDEALATNLRMFALECCAVVAHLDGLMAQKAHKAGFSVSVEGDPFPNGLPRAFQSHLDRLGEAYVRRLAAEHDARRMSLAEYHERLFAAVGPSELARLKSAG